MQEGDRCRCLDSGNLLQPLGLVVPEEAAEVLSIAECIRSWHTQLHCHALVAAPDWIVLQYPRFRAAGMSVTRCHRGLQICETIQIPHFQNDILEVHWESFAVLGLILHSGATPMSGHYTCLLRRHGAHCWTENDDLNRGKGRVYGT